MSPKTSLGDDPRVILVQRGNARVMFTMEHKEMWTSTAREVAATAIVYLIQLEGEFPGRSEMSVSMGSEMALAFPGALGILDATQPIGPQLLGRWEDMEFDVTGDTEKLQCPCCKLMLVDLNRN